ncbi:MAG: choloylglycine hydrolase [Clostridia bacterium]|nr:choloylglycine hydrolase [Clostridia bacterium]
MCTAISHCGERHLFGRTLDLECSYGEQVVITPRNFRLDYLHEAAMPTHAAMIGVACVAAGRPLYYDAINEAGLAMAGLNFPAYARYHAPAAGAYNVASFELIPWVLGQCRTREEALALLRHTNITTDCASDALPATPLHWMVADRSGASVVESVETGTMIYENPFGVLTNSPPFLYHLTHLTDYMQLGAAPAQNRLCPSATLRAYSRGMGAMGLPGDGSSASRFVRAVFAENHTTTVQGEEISRFFHVMDAISVPRGCIRTDEGKEVLTLYTSCADTATGQYYFTTYGCRRIRGVSLDGAREGGALSCISMQGEEDISWVK